jgi:hypothetical protein
MLCHKKNSSLFDKVVEPQNIVAAHYISSSNSVSKIKIKWRRIAMIARSWSFSVEIKGFDTQ